MIGMISLSSSQSKRFLVIEVTQCAYQDSEASEICGILTDRGIFMPFGVPPMPLCTAHAFEFRDWTIENTIEQLAAVLFEDENIEKWRNSEDDDI